MHQNYYNWLLFTKLCKSRQEHIFWRHSIFYTVYCQTILLVGVRCRFSQMLTPIFDEAGKQIKNEFPVCKAVG